MARVPLVRIGEVIVVNVPEDIADVDALTLQEDLNATIEKAGARGVLLNLTSLELVDSFLGRLLNEIASGASLLGAHTVVVGIQPAVAMTLVELGLELRGVRTCLNTEKGFALLDRLLAHRVGR